MSAERVSLNKKLRLVFEAGLSGEQQQRFTQIRNKVFQSWRDALSGVARKNQIPKENTLLFINDFIQDHDLIPRMEVQENGLTEIFVELFEISPQLAVLLQQTLERSEGIPQLTLEDLPEETKQEIPKGPFDPALEQFLIHLLTLSE